MYLVIINAMMMGRGSSVSIVAELVAGRPGFDSRQVQGVSSLRRRVQTGSGAHPASCQMGTEVHSRDVNLTTHLHLATELGIRGAMPPLPHTSSWRGTELSTGQLYLRLYKPLHVCVDDTVPIQLHCS
jgi:hypothetical protein